MEFPSGPMGAGLDASNGFGGQFCMRPDQIFTDVHATVADKFVELIVDKSDDFFEKLKSEIGVDFDSERNVISGNLEQVILTKMRMEKYVTEQHLWNPTDEKLEECRIAIKREIESSEEDCEKNSYQRSQPTKSRRKVRAPRKLTMNSDSNKTFLEPMDEETPVNMIIQISPKDVMTSATTSSATNRSNFSAENVVVKVESETSEDLCSKSLLQWQMVNTMKTGNLSLDGNFKDTSEEKRIRDSGLPFEYSCELCPFVTLKEGQLLKHVLIHGKTNIMHACDKCSFITVSLSHFNRHLLCHSENVFKCPECTFHTDEARQLTRHVTMKHSSVNIQLLSREDASSILQCSECAYNTTKIYHFERHLLVHNRDLQSLLQVYQCDECPYKTHRKEHYHRHRNNVHIRSRPYQCNYCRRSYKTLNALREHVLASHNVLASGMDNPAGVLSVSSFDRFVSTGSDVLTE